MTGRNAPKLDGPNGQAGLHDDCQAIAFAKFVFEATSAVSHSNNR